jgi:hypothetical protein
MTDKLIPIDFDIDNMVQEGHPVVVPKFAKAMVRITKLAATQNKKILFAYPNYFCRYTSVLMVGSYFHFVSQRHSRAGTRILAVSKSVYSLSDYQKLCNSFGTPFVDFVYSGYLSKQGFSRLKPYGSARGSPAGKIEMKYSNVFIVKPGFLDQVLDQHFDLCIVEDCQMMTSKRYYKSMEKLATLNIPTVAIMTVPDARIANKFHQIFGFHVLGWDENLLVSDARTFSDSEAFGLEETYFPTVSAIELPIDDYHTTLNLAWNAYAKSRSMARGLENETVQRIFIELAKIMHSLMDLCVPWELMSELQEAAGKYPLVKRLALVRMLISQIPRSLSDNLELETILNLCESALSVTPTKQKYYQENLRDDIVYFIAAADEITAQALKTYFTGKRGLNVITPEMEGQIKKSRVLLNSITGKVAQDYRTMKKIRTEKLEVLVYTHEKEFLERFEINKAGIRELLAHRIQVIKDLKQN